MFFSSCFYQLFRELFKCFCVECIYSIHLFRRGRKITEFSLLRQVILLQMAHMAKKGVSDMHINTYFFNRGEFVLTFFVWAFQHIYILGLRASRLTLRCRRPWRKPKREVIWLVAWIQWNAEIEHEVTCTNKYGWL
jgi:hypothetical protein